MPTEGGRERRLSNGIFECADKKVISFKVEKAANRVRAGFSPALPTPPSVRVRTGRFITGRTNHSDSETQSRVRGLKPNPVL